jgi:hypothetical protein
MDTPTSWLNLELLAPLLEGGQPLLGVAGQVNVHARSHTCNMVFYHGPNTFLSPIIETSTSKSCKYQDYMYCGSE